MPSIFEHYRSSASSKTSSIELPLHQSLWNEICSAGRHTTRQEYKRNYNCKTLLWYSGLSGLAGLVGQTQEDEITARAAHVATSALHPTSTGPFCLSFIVHLSYICYLSFVCYFFVNPFVWYMFVVAHGISTTYEISDRSPSISILISDCSQ